MDNHSHDVYDAIVLGAGISGLVASSILLNDDCLHILILDSYGHFGGNHINVNIGEYSFDIGSFIFQNDSPLIRHFPELLPLYVDIDPTWQRLNPQGVVTKYPLSLKDDLFCAGPIEWARIVASVVFSRLFHRRMKNAKDFARYWIGSRFLRRSGLENYMERFYGLPPEKIELAFAEKRMSWISEYASLNNPMLKKSHRTRQGPINRQLARPKEGFHYLYKAAADKLAGLGADIALGTTVSSIKKVDGLFEVQCSDQCLRARRVISTFPLHTSLALCGIDLGAELQSVRLISLFYSFDGTRGFPSSILYNFSFSGPWKRLTIYSDFYGLVKERQYFGVEVNADHVEGSVETADRKFREHVAANNLFVGNLILEGSQLTSNAYPIYLDGATDLARKAVLLLSDFGIESIGRQGRFDYQPTARDTTLKAEIALGGG
ncbi:MAG: hypothetical protein JWL66_1617 [Sphingomonadales bacterium]|nr:hypothetical protein [Sphingomonadales bacterium]